MSQKMIWRRQIPGKSNDCTQYLTEKSHFTQRSRFESIILLSATFGLMTLWAIPMLLVRAAPFAWSRRFNAEVMLRSLARTVLALWGVQTEIHCRERIPNHQSVFVSNHSSTIDLFIITSLGLRDTRYFLKGSLRWVWPLGLIASLTGAFFTYPQSKPQKRVRCFQRAERVLRESGSSVYLSPEGTRVVTGEIGPFNKGAFHLATNLRVPIVPLYIRIPALMNPGKGLIAGRGTVEVFVQPPISTLEWKIDDLEHHKDKIRNLFVHLHTEQNASE